MSANTLYKHLIERKVRFADARGYTPEKFGDLATDAIFAARHAERRYKTAIGDQDDFFQEMMAKAIANKQYFNSAGNLRGTVFSTTRNIAIDSLNRSRHWTHTRQKLSRIPVEDLDKMPVATELLEDEDRVQRTRAVSEILQELSANFPTEMQTMTYRHGNGKRRTIEETARALGISKKSVSNHQRRVKDYLHANYPDAPRTLFGMKLKTRNKGKKTSSGETPDKRETHNPGVTTQGECDF